MKFDHKIRRYVTFESSCQAAETPKAALSAKEVEALRDSPQLAPYMRMRMAGVPLQSIKHKMAMDKIDQR
jgi:hypothetical protein